MTTILIFKCTEGAGVGDYSAQRKSVLYCRMQRPNSVTLVPKVFLELKARLAA